MTSTFVGMPAFPEAARSALGDSQLRHNLTHATHTIRDKRARVVAEVADWEELRQAGADLKDAALLALDRHLEAPAEELRDFAKPDHRHGWQDHGCRHHIGKHDDGV